MKQFTKATTVRAVRTAAQVFIGFLGVETIADVDWTQALGATALATLASVATSLATGLPEAPEG